MYTYKYNKYNEKINLLQGGDKNSNSNNNAMNFDKSLELYAKIIDKSKELEKIYDDF